MNSLSSTSPGWTGARRRPVVIAVKSRLRSSSRLIVMLVSSVVVHDFHAPGVPCFPLEAHPPLLIDADAVLPFSAPLQSFQPISGRDPERVKARSGVEHHQLPSRRGL